MKPQLHLNYSAQNMESIACLYLVCIRYFKQVLIAIYEHQCAKKGILPETVFFHAKKFPSNSFTNENQNSCYFNHSMW